MTTENIQIILTENGQNQVSCIAATTIKSNQNFILQNEKSLERFQYIYNDMQNYRVQLTILNNTYLVNIKCNLCKYNIKGYFIAVFNPALNNSDF